MLVVPEAEAVVGKFVIELMVLRGGIEPPTRGFSVLISKYSCVLILVGYLL